MSKFARRGLLILGFIILLNGLRIVEESTLAKILSFLSDELRTALMIIISWITEVIYP